MRSHVLLALLAGCSGGWLCDARILVDGDRAAATDCRSQVCRYNAGVAPIDRHRFLLTWYSSRIAADQPWIIGILGPTDIWQATLDLSHL
jgi:hypothetical protein